MVYTMGEKSMLSNSTLRLEGKVLNRVFTWKMAFEQTLEVTWSAKRASGTKVAQA